MSTKHNLMGCMFCHRSNGVALFGIGTRWICGDCAATVKPDNTMTTPMMIEDLIELCHPDRHPGPMQMLATRTTQWLLDWRKRAKARVTR